MIEYICSFEEEHGFLVSASMKYGEELIRCKDCKYWPYKAITYASADPYLESYPHCFQKNENWYCGDAEREEE